MKIKINKFSIILLIVLVVASILVGLFIKSDVFKSNMKGAYISSCQESIPSSIPMSDLDLYDACYCSYDKIHAMLGDEKTEDFVKVVLEKDASKTNEFLKKNKVNVVEFDSYFLSCF
ncbi:MAG: hypothetical protein OIF36_00205 [Alphaproteobacteria bacterium]|nr:hypothetical protein [Alphaproteobacteria bacterium]